MQLPELKRNSLLNLRRTFLDLASLQRQSAYKRSVPFVHVPIELLEQSSSHLQLLKEEIWFRELLPRTAVERLLGFDALANEFRALFADFCPDVEEIHGEVSWIELCREAERVVADLPDEGAIENVA